RLTRWILALQEYDFSVTHRPGRYHSNANSLSRLVNSLVSMTKNFDHKIWYNCRQMCHSARECFHPYVQKSTIQSRQPLQF
ncbi:17942_t:CDS:1, partial [Racocetra persica]